MNYTINNRKLLILAATLFIITVGGGWLFRGQLWQLLFNLTGEEETLPQISGVIQYGVTRIQPPLQTADNIPVQYADINPYGINSFLQNEVEPEKREKAMRLISEAGIKWIRQEFTWEDIEIHGKGDFEDRRHEPYKSAWAKYDNIVELAEKYNINIMARLSNPPAWTRVLTNSVGGFAPPDNLTDYGDFAETLATRYSGRIKAYQIWNEPNIYPEWGEYPINAVEYTALLKEGYTRIKAGDPQAIVVMGALAATIELDRVRRYAPNGWPVSPGGLSDVLFLQQMYDAGAAPYFDVLAMQGYGLWSGPTDRRMQPRVLNFSRPLYIRDVMVRNGDAHKPIWLSELGWNTVPPDSGIPPNYGQVSPEQQARYTTLAYQRIQEEWPWLGVGFYWFFKQADDREKESNPQYYFRMVEPDFTPLPVYKAIKEQANQKLVMYQGHHQANHWAVEYKGSWKMVSSDKAVFKQAISGQVGDKLSFVFNGSRLELSSLDSKGRLKVQIDGGEVTEIELNGDNITKLAHTLPQKPHNLSIEVAEGTVLIDGYIITSRPALLLNRAGSALMVLATLGGLWTIWKQKQDKNRDRVSQNKGLH